MTSSNGRPSRPIPARISSTAASSCASSATWKASSEEDDFTGLSQTG